MESTGLKLPGQYTHGRDGLVFNTFNLFKIYSLQSDSDCPRWEFDPLLESLEGSDTRLHIVNGLGTFPMQVERTTPHLINKYFD